MILVDVNLLLYAEDERCPFNKRAREWWDAQMSGTAPVCLCWPVITAFLRIATNPRIFEHPLAMSEAIARVQNWFAQPCIRLVLPTDRHWETLKEMLADGAATRDLVSDAQLAALALEHGCVLYSADSGFGRFPRLRWENPLR